MRRIAFKFAFNFNLRRYIEELAAKVDGGLEVQKQTQKQVGGST
jgi:hypothetical protein